MNLPRPFFSTLLLTALALAAPLGLSAKTAADTAFEALAKASIDDYLRLNPETATQLGDHRFDGDLTDYSPAGLKTAVDTLNRQLADLAKIDASALTGPNRVDAQILQLNLEAQIFALVDLREQDWNPLVYNGSLANAIYLLTAREFAPPAQRLRSVISRLHGFPAVIAQAKATLRNPARIHTETAILQTGGAINLVRSGLDELVSQAPELKADFAAAQTKALAALTDYKQWLEKDVLPHANGDFRLGADRYRKKLHYTLASDLSPEEILARAERELATTTDALYATALPLFKKYFPDAGDAAAADHPRVIKAVLDRLADNHLDDDTVVARAKELTTAATAFVREHQLVTVPETPLKVIVLPEFQRGVAIAYCDSPGALEPNGETFYAVSPTPADWTAARKLSFFREYNDYMLHDLTVHEAMPGHYLQLAHSNQFQAPTLVRAIFQSGTFIEGWAVYAERVMADTGFGGPEVKMQQLKMRLRAIINAILDQKVHMAGMTEQEALDLMIKRGFQEEGEAVGKWRRACQSSGQLSSYFVGAVEHDDMRAAAEKKFGASFNLKSYHDLILSVGSPAVKFVREEVGLTAPNPLLTASPLPFHYPQFDLIKNEHFLPAYEQGMAEELKEIEAIATNPAAPTFENTIVALEKSGELLDRVSTVFGNLNGANTNPEMQKIQRTLAPRLSAHHDAIRLNSALFARISQLYAARDTLGLDPESKRLLWRYYKDYVRSGAKLSDADKPKLKALNAELATLQTTFTQNVLKERSASSVLFASRDELAGLSDAEIAAAATAAKKAGHDGQFLITLGNTTGQAPLTNLTVRASRERIMAASLARGSHGGEFDNRAVVSAIAKKRAERAALLGYPNHAAYQLEEQTIGGVDALNKLLAQLAPAAVANARREAADMQTIIDAEHGGFTLAAHDWDLYSEKVRQARYAFDENQLRPYFELNHVLLDGVFYAAGRLYGLTFKERHDLPVYEPTVRVFDVFEADGSQLAIFLVDYYSRSNKNGGAWASAYVPQNGLTGDQPVIANHLNIPPPPAGQPTLLTPDEVKTAFHEFGHALHGMFSHVKYPRFAGTGVPRDFVEFPSQVNEMWQYWPEVLSHYAKHYQTGAPIPAELVAKVQAADKFNQGFLTTEYLAATLLDQAYHQIGAAEVPDADHILEFEAAALKKYGVDFAAVPPRYRTTYFSHTFSGGYSAGYYSYIWSEVLAADSVDWTKAHGGLLRENGDRFRRTLLSRGGSDEALQLFRDYTGGEPDVKPLLVRRGLDQPK